MVASIGQVRTESSPTFRPWQPPIAPRRSSTRAPTWKRRARDPARRAPADLREVLPPRPEPDGRL